MEKPIIKKRKSHAFGKDIYLLGTYESGETFWIEAASWDCDWYWGFGYIETYTHENPKIARDIQSHSHYDSGLAGKKEVYDTKCNCWRLSSEYRHILNDDDEIKNTTITEKEQWELSELMRCFYTLKETAELYHRGGSHVAQSELTEILKNKEEEDRINKVLLPAIFERIYALLTPEKEGV